MVPWAICRQPVSRNKTSIHAPVFHVNQESREEAFRHFVVFYDQQKCTSCDQIIQQIVYFNPAVDTVLVCQQFVDDFKQFSCPLLSDLSQSLLESIKYLEIRPSDYIDEDFLILELDSHENWSLDWPSRILFSKLVNLERIVTRDEYQWGNQYGDLASSCRRFWTFLRSRDADVKVPEVVELPSEDVEWQALMKEHKPDRLYGVGIFLSDWKYWITG